MSKEVPEHWAKAMVAKGFTHNGKPSISRLAGRTTLAIETVRRMVFGIGSPEQAKVNQVADALGVSRITVNQWIGIARSVEESYEPPVDADLMDSDQRKAVDRVIQLFVDGKKAGGFGARTAPIGTGSARLDWLDRLSPAEQEEMLQTLRRLQPGQPRRRRRKSAEPEVDDGVP